MNVENMTSRNGNKAANQFIITEEGRGALDNFIERKTFQSYNSVIAVITKWENDTRVKLDRDKWDYSQTTGIYRNIFLNETKKETEAKIKSGEYILTDLNS